MSCVYFIKTKHTARDVSDCFRLLCPALLQRNEIRTAITENMPSSKGKPTDPKLREKVKDEVKNETNKDGGGKGQWSAWKVRDTIVL